VDQILMAALTSRHVFVRLFGLAGKTVIVDEVHAYDTYMSTLLERLLEWLAAMGTSVVLLSATLPAERRTGLLNAYACGLRVTGLDDARPVGYPRITTISSAGTRSITFPSASPHAGTRIRIERVPEESIGVLLGERLAGGGCAVVVCNTRRDAQRLFHQLQPHFPDVASDSAPELDLLHSHFLFADRDVLEKRCLRRFGKPDKGSVRPQRAVLIATQVVEQSLDLDFDQMVSALAPIDLLFQRVGRLHRHRRARPPQLTEPSLFLIDTPLDEHGTPTFPRGHQSVYEPHVLLRSWLALQGRDRLAIPEDIDDLLEAVYRNQPEPPSMPEAVQIRWRETRQGFLQHRLNEQAAARDRYLRSPASNMAVWDLAEAHYANDDPEQAQLLAVTRLAEPSVRVVILRQGERHPVQATVSPSAKEIPLDGSLSFEQVRLCLYSSVTISDRRLVAELADTPPPAAFRSSPLLSEHRLLLVGGEDSARVGTMTVRLDPRLGVVIEYN
jgi:CRISPR-associated endonuclease/helicase Cas3